MPEDWLADLLLDVPWTGALWLALSVVLDDCVSGDRAGCSKN